jgi:hypothetical protein
VEGKMSTYRTTIYAGKLGELDVTIHYDFMPAERPGYLYPGCDAEVDITHIEVDDCTLPDYVVERLMRNCRRDWESEILDHEVKMVVEKMYDREDYFYD